MPLDNAFPDEADFEAELDTPAPLETAPGDIERGVSHGGSTPTAPADPAGRSALPRPAASRLPAADFQQPAQPGQPGTPAAPGPAAPATPTSAPPGSRGDGATRPPAGAQPQQPAGDVVFPPELLRETGLTEQEARQQFGSAAELEAAVRFHDRQMMQVARQHRPPQQPFQPGIPAGSGQPAPVIPNQFGMPPAMAPLPPAMGQAPVAPLPGQPGQPQPGQPQQPPAAGKYQVNLDPEMYEEHVIQAFNGLNDHYHGAMQQQQQEISLLKNSLATLLQQQIVEADSTYYEEFDRILGELPEEYREVFGTGRGSDLDPQSPQFKNRAVIDRTIIDINQGRRMSGLPPLSLRQVMPRAVRSEFSQVHDTTVRNQIASQVSTRQRQFTSRPSGRRATGMTPEESAIQRVDALLASRGVATPAYVPEPEDF